MPASPAHRPVDRHSPLPLWAQVETDLTRRIAAGDFARRFPTETELVADYGVSRHTVREALRRLRTSGTLHSTRGRGTRVAELDVEQPLGTLYSLFRSVEDRGMTQTSTVLRLATTTDHRAAQELHQTGDTPLVVLERLRHADGQPLAHDTVYLPHAVAAPLLQADFTHAGLYDELARRCGIRLTSGQERITAAPATTELNALLDAGDHPLLRVDRTGCIGDRVLETRTTHLRSDRFALISHWNRTEPHPPQSRR